jgi:hypothetical protein
VIRSVWFVTAFGAEPPSAAPKVASSSSGVYPRVSSLRTIWRGLGFPRPRVRGERWRSGREPWGEELRSPDTAQSDNLEASGPPISQHWDRRRPLKSPTLRYSPIPPNGPGPPALGPRSALRVDVRGRLALPVPGTVSGLPPSRATSCGAGICCGLAVTCRRRAGGSSPMVTQRRSESLTAATG